MPAATRVSLFHQDVETLFDLGQSRLVLFRRREKRDETVRQLHLGALTEKSLRDQEVKQRDGVIPTSLRNAAMNALAVA